jgi:NADH-quinone oxidoreductase subunit N
MTFAIQMTAADLWALLPELLLSGLLCLILTLDFIKPSGDKRLLAHLSNLGLIVILAVIAQMAFSGVERHLFGSMFTVDKLSLFFKAFIVLSTIMIIAVSVEYTETLPAFRGEYYVMVLFSALGMLFMASANDLLTMFITLEFSTFGFYVLVAYQRKDPASSEAGLKLFILGAFTASLIAFGISLIYGETGTLLFDEIAQRSHPITPGLVVGFLLILAGLGFKIGAAPFHAWIPDTYQGAPTPVTAFLSIAPKGAAFAVLLRFLFSSFGADKAHWVWLLVLLSILSMTYGNLVAIAQSNIKRLLAYSGIAQIGNILIGLAAASKTGSDAVLFYLLTYLFANLGAFAVIIAVSQQTSGDLIDDYKGLNRRSPMLAATMLIFLLSLAGVPPLAGFIGKLYLFVAAAQEGLFALIIIGLINVIISLYYYMIVVKKIYVNEPVDSTPLSIPPMMKTVIVGSAALVLILGIYPRPFFALITAATQIFAGVNIALLP